MTQNKDMKKKIKKIFIISLILYSSCSNEGLLVKEGCNPISIDDCLLPFPSSFFLRDDETTATGFRVNYDYKVLPVTSDGKGIDPSPYNEADGFSPASQILVYFKEGVEPSTLPQKNDIGASVSEESSIQIIEWGTGERVPLFAELDANAKSDQRQGLIIRPQLRLKPGTRYIVLIKNKVKSKSGSELNVPEAFRLLRDSKKIKDKTLAGLKDRYEEVFQFLEKNQVKREEIILAWDFVTASDTYIHSKLLTMRDIALNDVATGMQVRHHSTFTKGYMVNSGVRGF